MKVTVSFDFNSTVEAAEFLENVDGSPVAQPPVPSVNQNVGFLPDVMPTQQTNVTTTPARVNTTAPTMGDGELTHNVTQVQVKNALRDYKAAHGHAKYKEILAYFKAKTVRDIQKPDYASVIAMTSGGVIERPVGDVVPNGVDPLDLPIEEVTGAQMKQGLSEHKNAYGMDATYACLARLGYANANEIPAEDYGRVLAALAQDVPTQQAQGEEEVDLSAF